MTRPLNRYERRRLREMREHAPSRAQLGDPVVTLLESRYRSFRSDITRLAERAEADIHVLETGSARIGEFGAKLEALGRAGISEEIWSAIRAREGAARRFSAEAAAAVARAVPMIDLRGAKMNDAVKAELSQYGYIGEEGPEVFDPKPPEPEAP